MKMRIKKYSSYAVVSLILFFTITTLAQATESTLDPSIDDIVSAVQKLCGGSGSDVDLKVTGEGSVEGSKTVSLLVKGKLAGTTTFTDAEWNGVRAMRDDSASYTECIKSPLAMHIVDKFSKKKLPE